MSSERVRKSLTERLSKSVEAFIHGKAPWTDCSGKGINSAVLNDRSWCAAWHSTEHEGLCGHRVVVASDAEVYAVDRECPNIIWDRDEPIMPEDERFDRIGQIITNVFEASNPAL